MTKKMEKTHWKNNFNYDYLGAYSFKEGEEVKFTIKSIAQEKVMGSGGKKETCTVAHFLEPLNKEHKPMILNKTNCKIISKMYGTPYIEDWIGKSITVFVEDNIKAFGDVVSALRISPIKPVLPKLIMDSDNYKKAIDYMKTKGASIENIKKKYDLSEDVESKLKSL